MTLEILAEVVDAPSPTEPEEIIEQAERCVESSGLGGQGQRLTLELHSP